MLMSTEVFKVLKYVMQRMAKCSSVLWKFSRRLQYFVLSQGLQRNARNFS
jgi:hypothetical protein